MIYKLSFESNYENDKLFREVSNLKKEELVYKSFWKLYEKLSTIDGLINISTLLIRYCSS